MQGKGDSILVCVSMHTLAYVPCIKTKRKDNSAMFVLSPEGLSFVICVNVD